MRIFLFILLFLGFNVFSQNMPKSLWKVKYESSHQAEFSASNIIDGDTTSYWHSGLKPTKFKCPHEIQIDLGATASFNAVVLTPRKNNTSGRCSECEISISSNGENWQSIKTASLFWYKNNDFSDQTIDLGKYHVARFIRFRHLRTYDNGLSDTNVGTLAELSIKGEYIEPIVVADFSLNQNPPDLVVNQKVYVENKSIAYQSEIKSLKWISPGAKITTDKKGNATLIYSKCGSYSISMEVTNDKGFTSYQKLNQPINILPGPNINRQNWLIKSFSEECPAYDAYARNSIDSIFKTRWLTSWDQLKALPHFIVYDLGDRYNINGFGYLPSQYVNDEGAATAWKFFISSDGKNWGTPIATGEWTYDNLNIKYVQLNETKGRYVKFQIDKSLPEGQNYANCSEFYVYGTAANSNYSSYIFGILVMTLFVLTFGFWRRRKRLASNNILPNSNKETISFIEETIYKTQIYLFGEFKIIHQNNDISADFYPKIKHLLALMLYYKEGISVHKLTDLLWPGMTADKASSNRGTNILNLKKSLSEIEGIKMVYAGKQWNINLDETVYCDYYQYKELIAALSQNREIELVKKLCNLLEKAGFLKDLDAECFDDIKASITEEVTNTLAQLIIEMDVEISPDLRIRIADCILLFDELSEIAIEIKIKTLIQQNKQGIAKLSFDKFSKKYNLIYNCPYPKNFNSFQ